MRETHSGGPLTEIGSPRIMEEMVKGVLNKASSEIAVIPPSFGAGVVQAMAIEVRALVVDAQKMPNMVVRGDVRRRPAHLLIVQVTGGLAERKIQNADTEVETNHMANIEQPDVILINPTRKGFPRRRATSVTRDHHRTAEVSAMDRARPLVVEVLPG